MKVFANNNARFFSLGQDDIHDLIIDFIPEHFGMAAH
jgi:hypothetical protein